MSTEQTENQTQKKNTGVDLQNSASLKEKPKRDHRKESKELPIGFLEKKSKVINDPIHGLIELHPLLIKIMDTPQFQRLRHIKQLGGAYFVYPGASHNRFEHSVGVAHLAGELARALGSKQPELGIDERDILCVQIAGLCHDLGHGPFSHLYDVIFIPKACGETQWKHEDASLRMFDHLVEDNGLKPLMELYGLKFLEEEEENDLVFIKEIIRGEPLTEAQNETDWSYQGRTEKKSFLYEVVSNKLNEIDVDKFDYLARDTYHLGMQSNFDHKRFIMLAKVCEVEGETEETKKPRKHICSRDKEVGNLYDMFHTRNYLHRRVHQHKTNKSIEIMISDAFLEADEHIEIEGSGGKMFTLSTAKDDMVAYTKLTDHVFETILHPSPLLAPMLRKATEILERIVSRKLYMFVGEAKPKQEGQAEMPEIPREDIKDLKATLARDLFQDENQADNFEVSIVTLDYGMKKKDPINNTYFYRKSKPTTGFKISENQKSKLLPAVFSEKIMRVYCKNPKNITLEEAREALKRWCTENEYVEPVEGDRVVDLN